MTMPRKSTIVPTLILSAICLGLGGIMYWQLTGRGDPRDMLFSVEAAPEQDDPIADEAEQPAPPREQFAEVVSRPLFSPTRRPPEQVGQAQEGVPSDPLDIDLLGVVIWQSQRLALVRPRNDATVMQLAVGGTVLGWTVVVIEPNHVTFRHGESEHEVRLPYKEGEAVANE